MDKEKLGFETACWRGYSLFEALRKGKKLGFKTVELSVYNNIGKLPGFWFRKLSHQERQQLKQALVGYKYISTHAPFIDLPLFTYNEEIKQVALTQIKEAIDATYFFDGRVTIVHANAKSGFQLHEYWDEMLETFRALGDYAAQYATRLGIETGFPNTVKEYTNLIIEIDHPQVGATIDVGHIVAYMERELRGTNRGMEKFNQILLQIVEILKEKLYHFHLHDVSKHDFRDHRMTVGEGVVDFARLFSYLTEVSYDGQLIFELEEENKEESLKKSKEYIDDLL